MARLMNHPRRRFSATLYVAQKLTIIKWSHSSGEATTHSAPANPNKAFLRTKDAMRMTKPVIASAIAILDGKSQTAASERP